MIYSAYDNNNSNIEFEELYYIKKMNNLTDLNMNCAEIFKPSIKNIKKIKIKSIHKFSRNRNASNKHKRALMEC